MITPLLQACLPLALLAGVWAQSAPRFELKDGDRVALIGCTFVEREQRDGFLELALTLAAPEADVAFRNLGWSGDTVEGRARRYFGRDADGRARLLEHLDLVAPSVILLCYGTNEAFDGQGGRASFLAGYRELLEACTKRTERLVILSAPPLDVQTSPAPAVARQTNTELAWQASSLRALAQERGLGFVDLFTRLAPTFERSETPGTWTDNGMHLTPRGYRLTAAILLDELGLSATAGDTPLASSGGASHTGSGQVPLAPFGEALSPARERLRQLVLAKNELFFHRHRPENETYLRGFRKHEQGNNAAEIFALDELIEARDRELFALRAAVVREEGR